MHPDVQKGIAAYKQGDFESAFRILSPFVYEPVLREPERHAHRGIPNVWASLYVGRMLRYGQGTQANPAAGCAILKAARIDMYSLEVDPAQPLTTAVRALMNEICLGVSEEEAAAAQNACFARAMPRSGFITARGVYIEITPEGIDVWDGSHGIVVRDLPRFTCADRIVDIRYTHLASQKGPAGSVREFIDFLIWRPREKRTGSGFDRVLVWHVLEFAGAELRSVLVQDAVVVDGNYLLDLPEPALRDDFTLHSAGEGIEWAINTGERRSGIFD